MNNLNNWLKTGLLEGFNEEEQVKLSNLLQNQYLHNKPSQKELATYFNRISIPLMIRLFAIKPFEASDNNDAIVTDIKVNYTPQQSLEGEVNYVKELTTKVSEFMKQNNKSKLKNFTIEKDNLVIVGLS